MTKKVKMEVDARIKLTVEEKEEWKEFAKSNHFGTLSYFVRFCVRGYKSGDLVEKGSETSEMIDLLKKSKN